MLKNYVDDYAKSYYFRTNNPAFNTAITSDDEKKSSYMRRGRLFAGFTSYFAAETIILSCCQIHTPIAAYSTMFALWGAAYIGISLESQTRFFARKLLHMPGRENILGSRDYNKQLRARLLDEITAYFTRYPELLQKKIEK